MRMALWILGAEVFAIDIGRSPQPEQEQVGATGGQFELGFQGQVVDETVSNMDDVLWQMRRIRRPGRGDDGPTPMGIR